jgi:hypothetical protein
MFDTEFWKEIKEKYPKGYMKIKKHLDPDCIVGGYHLLKYNGVFKDGFLEVDYCYCDIEKFFDEQGIIINYDKCSDDFIEHWLYTIRMKNFYDESGYDFYSRNEAKLEAIKKAFEISEEMENKK